MSGFTAAVRCDVTLEGSYHYRVLQKTPEALVGYVTGATVRRPCLGGEAWAFNGIERQGTTTLANSLPWHVRYESFSGSLPNITAVGQRLIGARFLVEAEFLGVRLRCNYTTSTTEPGRIPVLREVNTRALTEVQLGGEIRSDTGGCPRGRLARNAAIETPGGAAITVTLI